MYNRAQQGFTLIEVLLSVTIAGVLMAGISGVIGAALEAERITREKNDTLRQARFAMQRMVRAVTGTRHLLIP